MPAFVRLLIFCASTFVNTSASKTFRTALTIWNVFPDRGPGPAEDLQETDMGGVCLAPKAGAEISHAALPALGTEHGPVDDNVRRPSVLDIQHRLHVGSTIGGEKLICPAQRMWRQDDVVQLEDRIVGIGRLLRENV